MSLIHYFIFIPPTIIGIIYFGIKFDNIVPKKKVYKYLYWIGLSIFFIVGTIMLSPTMVFLLYSCMIFLITDIITFLLEKAHLNKIKDFIRNLCFHNITIIVIAGIITGYGLYNAVNPITRYIDIDISKELSPLKIVMLTDLHLGTGTNEDSIDKIVLDSNNEKADLFVMVGDIFDEHTTEELKDYAYDKFGDIKTTYGSYFVEGNHDLLTSDIKNNLESNNIIVLEDEYVFIDNTFYLIGRLDKKEERLSLSDLVKDININYPMILLNHRPDDIGDAIKLGIDLQLSGHTHAGQLFPANFVLRHGYYKINNYNLVVSPGYGNWGMPIRTYGHNELVVINLNSTK